MPQLLTRTGTLNRPCRVAGLMSERWPASHRRGGRLQPGIVAGFTSESLAGFNRNSHENGFSGLGDPIHLIKDVVKRHGIRVLCSNYTLYGDMQHRIVSAVSDFARDYEIYSIDETFLDLSGFEDGDLVAHVREMRE